VRNITKSSPIPSTVIHGEMLANQDIDKTNLFNKYIYSVFSQSSYSLPNFNYLPQTAVSIDSIDITEEVFNALSSLDTHEATGIDGISPAILKHCAIILTKPLHYLFS